MYCAIDKQDHLEAIFRKGLPGPGLGFRIATAHVWGLLTVPSAFANTVLFPQCLPFACGRNLTPIQWAHLSGDYFYESCLKLPHLPPCCICRTNANAVLRGVQVTHAARHNRGTSHYKLTVVFAAFGLRKIFQKFPGKNAEIAHRDCGTRVGRKKKTGRNRAANTYINKRSTRKTIVPICEHAFATMAESKKSAEYIQTQPFIQITNSFSCNAGFTTTGSTKTDAFSSFTPSLNTCFTFVFNRYPSIYVNAI